MQKITSPYRYDFVGSFLRPENLKQARKDYRAGKISKEQLTAVEDAAIRELVARQAITSSQTVNIAVNTGIWILCGALPALDMKRPAAVCSSMEKWQIWKIPT